MNKPFEHGDTVLVVVKIEVQASIVRFVYRRCFCRTEGRVKLERTHAIIQFGAKQMKVPYRKLRTLSH